MFLSATLSNAAEFAAWVAALHKHPCHVVYTDFRPTPLQHYAYAPGAKGLFLVRPLSQDWSETFPCRGTLAKRTAGKMHGGFKYSESNALLV